MLVIRPDHIGDVLLSAPAIARLRSRLPRARLSYLVGPWSADAAAHGPAVDEVRALEFPAFTRRPKASPLQPYTLLWRSARDLRREHFDAAIVLRPDHWWGALMARLAGIPIRIGAETPETSPLLTHRRPRQEDEHAAREALGLVDLAVRATGALAEAYQGPDVAVTTYRIPETAHAAAEVTWRRLGLSGRRVVVVQPMAGAALKSWPVERWVSVVHGLRQLGVEVLLVGGPGDGAHVEALRQAAAAVPRAAAAARAATVTAAGPGAPAVEPPPGRQPQGEPGPGRQRQNEPGPGRHQQGEPGPGRQRQGEPGRDGTDEPRVAVGQPLQVTAALYARAALLIGPDGGPAHLAAAVGTPTIRLYGPASVARFGPWPARADQVVLVNTSLACVPCGALDNPPCGARTEPACMLSIGAAEVLEAAQRVLATR